MEETNLEPEFELPFEDILESTRRDFEMAEMDRDAGIDIPSPVTWKQLNSERFPEDPWRVDKLIPKEGFAVVSSIAGERKTWFCLEMAKSIVSGKRFLGPDGFETIGCNVLYIDGENSKSELQRRGRQLGFSEDSDFNLYFYNDKEINLNSDEGAVWLHAIINYLKVNVVFIDTLRAVAGGLKEDKAEEVRAFYNRFRSLKDKGVTIVWLDHFRKPNNFEKKIPQKEHLLGSQDKTAGVEILLMLRSEPGSEEIQVYQRKNRLSNEIEPFSLSMKDEYRDDAFTHKRTILSYLGEIEEKETQKETAKKYALEILKESGRTTKELLAIIGKDKRVGQRNIRDALSELVDSEEVMVSKQSRENYYSIPEESLVEEE